MSAATEVPVTPAAAWQAVLDRDPAFDGRFVFGVRTTGVYCRPSCAARRPNRKNVTFHPTTEDARAAGFRACRRCRPDEPATDRLAEARSLLEREDDRLTLDQLATQVGMSPGHLQRRFKARYGVSPSQFQRARRTVRLRRSLRASPTVSRAGYDAGFGSSSRVYEGAAPALGMTPGRYARGGEGEVIGFAIADSAFGRILIGSTGRGVCTVLFGSSDRDLEGSLRREFPRARIERAPETAALRDLVRTVTRAMADGSVPSGVSLDLIGTAFQEEVWRALTRIPPGTTVSYGELAEAVGHPGSARAVAGAVARNRLAVLIPCHRVVRGDGTLGGYRWGTDRKRRILAAERGEPALAR